MAVTKIQKPWKAGHCKTVGQLQDAMTETHPSAKSFMQFKADVRRHARGLDTLKPKDKQDPAKWANLVRKMITSNPALNRYEDHWPIQYYFDRYSAKKRNREKRCVSNRISRPRLEVATNHLGPLDFFFQALYKSGNDTTSTTATPPAAGSGFPSEMDTNLNEHTPVGDEEEFEELLHIPPPALEDEVAMSKYSYLDFRTSLQYAMQLDDDFDDDLFGGLLDAMVEQSFRYFREPAPDEALLRKVIEVISATNPGQFERYTNYWPIRVYLRWLQTNIPVIRPKYTEEEEANIYVDVFARYPGNRIDK